MASENEKAPPAADGGADGEQPTASGATSAAPRDVSGTPNEVSDTGEESSPFRLGLLFAAMAVAVFCGGLDANLVAPAVPAITDSLGQAEAAGWYGTAYYLSLSCCQMAWAQIYKTFPAKPTFFGAFIVFELGALIGALAPNAAAVIIARAISGAGISGSFVGALIIVSYIVPLRWRPLMSALFTVLIGSTQTAGPVVGGVLTSRLSWRWCFWINLPLGGLALLLAFFGSSIKKPNTAGGKTRKQLIREFDWLGFGLWVPTVVCLTLILQFGGLRYAWGSGPLIALYVVMTALLGFFILVQIKKGDRALAPIRILTQRTVACSALYVLMMQAAKSQLAYFLPIFYQAAQGDTALQSGVNTIPSFLSYVIAQITAAAALSWVGYYAPFMLAGSALGIAGSALLATMMNLSVTVPQWVGYQILTSGGFGIGFNSPQIAVQAVFQDPADTPIAITIVTTCMDLGGSLGTSIGGAVLGDAVRRQLAMALPTLSTQAISDAGITGLQAMVSPAQRGLVAEAYAYGVRMVFFVTTALAASTLILGFFVEWRSIRKAPAKEKTIEDGENADSAEKRGSRA